MHVTWMIDRAIHCTTPTAMPCHALFSCPVLLWDLPFPGLFFVLGREPALCHAQSHRRARSARTRCFINLFLSHFFSRTTPRDTKDGIADQARICRGEWLYCTGTKVSPSSSVRARRTSASSLGQEIGRSSLLTGTREDHVAHEST